MMTRIIHSILFALIPLIVGQSAIAAAIPYRDTYSASSGYITPVASATDLFRISGSATKIVRILEISVAYQVASTISTNRFFVVKRSTANSAGTSSAPTVVPHDSMSPAPTAIALTYTANPTVGTLTGSITTSSVVPVVATTATSTGASQGRTILYSSNNTGAPIVLRGTGQGVSVNNNGVTVLGTTPTVAYTVVFTESDD